MKITREKESQLPKFDSHDSAREYFKKEFGSNFVMTDSDVVEGEKIYFYHLVIDVEEYLKGKEKLQRGEAVAGTDYMFSFQNIEVWEDGRVHIIY